MTNAPPTRKTHVIRIVGTNKAGDVLQDIWADVERMDIIKSATQLSNIDWQGHQKKLRWMDDPDTDEYDPDGNPARKTEIIKVCDPESQNVDDPDEWIPIPVIKSMRSRGAGGNIDGLGTMDRFRTGIDNDPTPTTRIVEVRRIPHYDTNIDDRAQAAFDADQSRKAYVVPGVDYEKNAGTKDDAQYVEHEIIKFIKHRTNETNPEIGGVNRGRQTKLRNQYLIDESDDAKLDTTGASGINPPYRLDPYQNIVNVKFKTLYLLVRLGGGNQSFSFGPYGAAPGVSAASINSKSNSDMPGVKLLDTFVIPGNTSGSGFFNCFIYPSALDPQTAWELFHTTGLAAGEFAAVNNSCPWPGPGPQPEDTNIVPVDFEAFATVATDYLYSIPVGDGLVTVSVNGIVPTSSTGDHVSTEVNISGSGTVSISVYSTVKGKITKLDQLVDYSFDGKLRPTEDDSCSVGITHGNQGAFKVNVKLDSNKADAQIDNYGNTFQPYKVTLDPSTDVLDQIPAQPPVRLPPK